MQVFWEEIQGTSQKIVILLSQVIPLSKNLFLIIGIKNGMTVKAIPLHILIF